MICHYYSEPQYFLYVPDLPGIIYYTHIPAIVLTLLVGTFVLLNERKSLLNQLLFALCLTFATWTLLSLISWTNIHSDFLLFTWSFFGTLTALIAILSIYFMHVFVERRDVRMRTKAVFAALVVPVIAFSPTAYSLTGFNIVNCDAFGFENFIYHAYYTSLGFLAMAWIAVLVAHRYFKSPRGHRRQLLIMGAGIEFFLFSFVTTSFLASYLIGLGLLPDSEIENYGYFGMVIFMVFIGFMIVRFKTFHANLIATQALVVAILVLIGSQLTYVRSTTNIILTGITFALTAIGGFILIRSVKREIRQRERIEHLASELEKSNEQQVILIHFITHQLKGFMSKARNIFAMIQDGDYGTPPQEMKSVLDEGLRSVTKGAQTIDEILNAANIKSGKVTYAKDPVDLKELTEGIVNDLRPAAVSKGLNLALNVQGDNFTLKGDLMQLTNAVKNLIDNAVKYTQQGSVTVTLARTGNLIRLAVEDTGVGITPEDMKVLFTEGGHGKESRKVNVESTGFGLYIVKNIVEAHQGKVWAESEGEGKGSRFIVELPVS